jgi:hypothetical protein
LWDFNETLIFLTDLKKNTQRTYFIKICPGEPELFHVGGQTLGQKGMTQLIAPPPTQSNFCKRAKNRFLGKTVEEGETAWSGSLSDLVFSYEADDNRALLSH